MFISDGFGSGSLSKSSNTYSPIEENWYRSFPYAFKATGKDGVEKLFYLPLNPSNISVTTHFATTVISTIGGTVEEHAPQRYFDINIQGTTGIAPQYVDVIEEESEVLVATADKDNPGRKAYIPAFTFSGHTGGLFAKTTGKLDAALNQASNVVFGDKKHEIGFSAANSGYMAFHNFYKFLLENKSALAVGSSSGSISLGSGKQPKPLKFISYKDNQEYTCAILRFQLERSAESPMLYNYSIVLRAYGLTSPGNEVESSGETLKSLGLDAPASLLSVFKLKVRAAKAAVAAVVGTAKSFGG